MNWPSVITRAIFAIFVFMVAHVGIISSVFSLKLSGIPQHKASSKLRCINDSLPLLERGAALVLAREDPPGRLQTGSRHRAVVLAAGLQSARATVPGPLGHLPARPHSYL